MDASKIFQVNTADQIMRTAIPSNQYSTSMWLPSRQKFHAGHDQQNVHPPRWMYKYFGLQDTISVTAPYDNVEYQEGQMFFELDYELQLSFAFSTFCHGAFRKICTNTLYEYSARI
jgi:hypothetical protein